MDDYTDRTETDLGATPPQPRTSGGGIYSTPIVGGPARAIKGFYDDMAPHPEDSTPVVVGKEMIRWGTVAASAVAGAALGLIVVF